MAKTKIRPNGLMDKVSASGDCGFKSHLGHEK